MSDTLKLSAPIFQLKRRAKSQARQSGKPLYSILDDIARKEGFASWSLLANKAAKSNPALDLLSKLDKGDLALIGARPGHGKTRLSLQAIHECLKADRATAFFTLEYHIDEVIKSYTRANGTPPQQGPLFMIDCSDRICADHIISQLEQRPSISLAVIDYLQLLDQRREHASLAEQIETLRHFVDRTGTILLCISQIDRAFETSSRSVPDLDDIRLPNPVNLDHFTKACFLDSGEMIVKDLR